MAAPPTATTASPGRSLPEPGAVVAGYRLEKLIAEGETGVVYEATKLSLDRNFAFKLVDSRLGADPGFRERFQREGRIQTTIEHPNIVAVFEVGESEYGLFVAMESVRGTSLKDLVGKGLEVERTVRILGQVAGALDAVHRAGLIHGDMRTDRILVQAENEDHAYLTDFGVTEDRHRSGLTGGATADYMAPERIRGEGTSASTDIYGLGAVLYECLSGSVPFAGESPAAVANAHLTEPPPRLAERRTELPSEVDDVIGKAMAKDPAERYGTATEMVQALELALAGGAAVETEPAAAEVSPAPAARPRDRSRRRYAFWAAAGLAVLALAAAGFFVGRGGSSTTNVSPPSTILAGGITFKVPAGWHRMTEPPAMPGVTFPGAVAIATRRETAKLIAARTDGEWPTLLPASFQARVLSQSELADGRDVVLLGKRQAVRYQDVSLRGDPSRLTVFVLPDRGHVEMLSCVVPAGAHPKIGKQCEGIAAAVRLPKSPSYSLLPQATYARVVSGAVTRLNRARQAGRTGLATAGSASEQALAARRVEDAYGQEAALLEKQSTEPLVASVNRQIVVKMRSVRAAYERIASSALQDSGTAFDEAKQLVRLREGELKTLFLELRFAGISVQ